ncbi:uncharacterized protein LOC129580318 [Sitodiplosis mosellana]|uniref:uncharacterized protein LOC129580318 n=1 Tax=Sitodiplosis mosellana TaxID=263140 RepID=UPI002443C9A3|nr:uncharacterized protein LOC129580318 [Sitodiplosis mosellana]
MAELKFGIVAGGVTVSQRDKDANVMRGSSIDLLSLKCDKVNEVIRAPSPDLFSDCDDDESAANDENITKGDASSKSQCEVENVVRAPSPDMFSECDDEFDVLQRNKDENVAGASSPDLFRIDFVDDSDVVVTHESELLPDNNGIDNLEATSSSTLPLNNPSGIFIDLDDSVEAEPEPIVAGNASNTAEKKKKKKRMPRTLPEWLEPKRITPSATVPSALSSAQHLHRPPLQPIDSNKWMKRSTVTATLTKPPSKPTALSREKKRSSNITTFDINQLGQLAKTKIMVARINDHSELKEQRGFQLYRKLKMLYQKKGFDEMTSDGFSLASIVLALAYTNNWCKPIVSQLSV